MPELKIFNYYKDHDIDRDEILALLKEESKDCSFDFTMEVANFFLESYNTDTEWEWPKLIRRYLNNPDQREIIDQVFVDLCGWSLAKLIEIGSKRYKELGE